MVQAENNNMLIEMFILCISKDLSFIKSAFYNGGGSNSEMTQQVKVLIAIPDDLSSAHESHMMEGEK